MTEPFFLTYANISLDEHPEQIKVILKAASALMPIAPFNEKINHAYDVLGNLYIATINDKKNMLSSIQSKYPRIEKPFSDLPGSLNELNLNVIHQQEFFKVCLDMIASGLDYEAMDLTLDYILKESQRIAISFKREKSFISQVIDWDYHTSIYADHALGLLLSSLFCFSLREFLLDKKNYQRLKKCPYCQKHFIAKDKKRKRCYQTSCSREYEKEKKRKQREDDPVIYL